MWLHRRRRDESRGRVHLHGPAVARWTRTPPPFGPRQLAATKRLQRGYRKAQVKIDELRRSNGQSKTSVLEEAQVGLAEINGGHVVTYNARRGGGSIRDDADGKEIFSHPA